jgi:hypothetical protein
VPQPESSPAIRKKKQPKVCLSYKANVNVQPSPFTIT